MIDPLSNSRWPDTAIGLLRSAASATTHLPACLIAKTIRHRLIERCDRDLPRPLTLDAPQHYCHQRPNRRSNPHSTRAHHTSQHRPRGFLP